MEFVLIQSSLLSLESQNGPKTQEKKSHLEKL